MEEINAASEWYYLYDTEDLYKAEEFITGWMIAVEHVCTWEGNFLQINCFVDQSDGVVSVCSKVTHNLQVCMHILITIITGLYYISQEVLGCLQIRGFGIIIHYGVRGSRGKG